jgi:lipopolysaccharide transport system permease protein
MTPFEKLLADSLWAARLWRVWLFFGLQDIRTRFRRSLLGPLWLFLNLAVFVGGVGLVFGALFGQPMSEFLPYLTCGFVLWGYLTSSLTDSGSAFTNAEGYIKQFSYPKQIYLCRAWISYTAILLIGFIAVALVQLIFGELDFRGWLLAIPGLLILLFAALGHIAICAYLGARFRDLPHALTSLMQVLFFVTPVIFPVATLRDRGLDFIYLYNPLYYLIEIVRHPIIHGELAAPQTYVVASLYVLGVWIVATMVARRLDSRVVFCL